LQKKSPFSQWKHFFPLKFSKKNFEKINASIGGRLKKKYERTKNERKITRERLRKNERKITRERCIKRERKCKEL